MRRTSFAGSLRPVSRERPDFAGVNGGSFGEGSLTTIDAPASTPALEARSHADAHVARRAVTVVASESGRFELCPTLPSLADPRARFVRKRAAVARLYFDFTPPAGGAPIGAAEPDAAGIAPGIGITPVCTSISTLLPYDQPFTIFPSFI